VDLVADAFEKATLTGGQLAPFIGDGQIDGEIVAAGGATLFPMSTDLTWSTSGFGIEGSIEVTYVFRERPSATRDPLTPRGAIGAADPHAK
jgi:hypothetical protein